MFELDDYFEIPDFKQLNKSYHKGTIGNYLLSEKNNVNTQAINIALVGIVETRNACKGEFSPGVELIRDFLYRLSHIPQISLCDLGNLTRGKQINDSYESIKYVAKTLLENNVIPLFFGGTHEISLPIFNAFRSLHTEVGLSIIDRKIDIEDGEFHSESFLSEADNLNTTISLLANQMYFNSSEAFSLAENNYWNIMRLGLLRSDYNQVEPILRDTDFISFDTSSIRQSDCPAVAYPSPNGLYAEEACQLANMCGMSDRVKAFYLAEYNADNDNNEQSAHLCAQILWHFIYGVSKRKGDYPVKELSNYKKIYVKIDKVDIDLIFYENTDVKRFWVEIPINKSQTKIISCSESDYKNVCNNVIPDRIWKNISRYM